MVWISFRIRWIKGLNQQRILAISSNKISRECLCRTWYSSCRRICCPWALFNSIILFQKMLLKKEKGVPSWVTKYIRVPSISREELFRRRMCSCHRDLKNRNKKQRETNNPTARKTDSQGKAFQNPCRA